MMTNDVTESGLASAVVAIRMTDLVFNRFRDLTICRRLQSDECMHLFSCFQVQRIDAGEVIYEEATASDHTLRLVVEGEASVSVADASTGVYTRLGAGDVFGLFSFLDASRPHSATLTAESDVVLLTINREYFNLITCEDPKLGNKMLRFMFQLLSQTALKLESEYIAMHEFTFLR
jgi:CRP-like cAMP-binding protein